MKRLETFADASFAFALSFASIIWFWIGHRKWSRRYGLEDNLSIIPTLILIFIMLVYVYPLRIIFSSLFTWITSGWLPGEFSVSSASELIDLFVIYGAGYFALCGVLALLYRHALKKNPDLEMDPYEKIKTDEEIYFWTIQGVTGLGSALFAIVFPQNIAVFAGFVYVTLPVTMPLASVYFDKKTKSLNYGNNQTTSNQKNQSPD
jgi:hypothetical protein